ncbi:MAG: OmpA family protein [Myxococcales bacterium]|nr:OmpA family protein [Myxococcales bacterium]
MARIPTIAGAAAVACCVLVCAAATQAQAPSSWLSVEAGAIIPVSAPQSDRFEPGGVVSATFHLPFSAAFSAGARLRAALFGDADGSGDSALADPGMGTLETLSGVLRLQPFGAAGTGPFLEAGAGGAVTGRLARPSVELGLGYSFEFAGHALSPALRYVQVVQPQDVLSDQDARLLSLGVEFGLDAAPSRSLRGSQHGAAAAAISDADDDGVADVRDQCPSLAEDLDGFADDDGCPEANPAPDSPPELPFDSDEDGIFDAVDGCPDAAEDPDGDRDGDGCPDLDEASDVEAIECGEDCDLPDSVAVEDGRIVLDGRVFFETERARVRNRARPALEAIARLIAENPHWGALHIEGHADDRGKESYNLSLSQRRAQNVHKALVSMGVPAERLQAQGFGSSRPNPRRDSHASNRRVEFVVRPGVAATTDEAEAPQASDEPEEHAP